MQKAVVKSAFVAVLAVLAFLLLTGCARPDVRLQADAQEFADTYTEVCINGRVYYAWRVEGTGGRRNAFTFTPKIISRDRSVNC